MSMSATKKTPKGVSKPKKLQTKSFGDLFDYTITDKDDIMEVRSDTLDPISSGQNKFTFRLEPTGYLDENSLLMFKLQATNAASNLCRVNCFNGALGAIKRVIFQVGEFVFNDIDSLHRWATCHHLTKINRNQMNGKMAHYMGNQLYTTTLQAAVPAENPAQGNSYAESTGAIVSNDSLSGIGLGGIADATSATGANNGKVARINSLRINSNPAQNHQYAIPLGLLVPALKDRQIPLFLFDEYRIYIIVYFEDCPAYVNRIDRNNYAGANAADPNAQYLNSSVGDVLPVQVQLQVDYLIYPAYVMEEDKMEVIKEQGYVMDFIDPVKIEKTLPAIANDLETQSVELRLGQNQREVLSIYMLRQLAKSTPTNTRGGVRSKALLLDMRCDGVQKEEYNITVNGIDEFPEYKKNPSSHYDELAMALGADLDLERPMYYCDDNTVYSGLASAYNPLLGTYKPLALDLQNGNMGVIGSGRVIGDYPIVWKYKRTGKQAVARALNAAGTGIPGVPDTTLSMGVEFFCNVAKRAIIQKTAKGGNNVIVAY